MTNIHLYETTLDKEKLFERVTQDLNKALKETVHEVEGAPQASLLMNNDQYRTNSVFGGQELFFKEAYIGKSGKMIFAFTPVDSMPWKQCEWPPHNLDAAIPLFGSSLGKAIGYEGSEKLPEILQFFIAKIEEEMKEEIEMQSLETATAYSNSDKFGKF